MRKTLDKSNRKGYKGNMTMTTQTKTSNGRGTCIGCGRDRGLTKKGTVAKHGHRGSRSPGSSIQHGTACEGSNLAPLEDKEGLRRDALDLWDSAARSQATAERGKRPACAADARVSVENAEAYAARDRDLAARLDALARADGYIVSAGRIIPTAEEVA